MAHQACIRIFNSQGQAYKDAFRTFLLHTDQKRNAKVRLQGLIETLPERGVFIDAGAGNGEVTQWFAPAFRRTIAVEPNDHLRAELQLALPGAEVIDLPILKAQPCEQGDLVLCSHTFYYIPADQWLAHLERLVSWMSPGGLTVVVLQHRESGCMNMVHHFFGHRFELRRTAEEFQAKHGDQYDVGTTMDPAHVVTPDMEKAYAVAEFMLNLLEVRQAPAKRDVEHYLTTHFSAPEGGYRIPVHQDFLTIRRTTRERSFLCRADDAEDDARAENLL